MGARPSQFKKGGGGFLKNVDGVISGYEMTDEFNGVAFVPGKDLKTGKERFHSLYSVLSARVDGADEDVTTTLFVGGFDDFEISDDGHTLTPVEEGRELGSNTAWGTFITTLCEAGFPETLLPEDVINFESIIGTRVRFTQRVNAEMKAKGKKRKDKKTGKEYDYEDLVIDQVYSLPGTQEAKPATVKAGKPAVAAKAAGKAAKAVAGTDVAEFGADTIRTIVAEVNSITKKKLDMKLIGRLMKHPDREAVRKWANVDANLDGIEGVDYDAATETLSVAA